MKLFTQRFIKDIILIALFGSALYILTHNPITHPLPQKKSGLWSIQLMQHPIIFGFAGHNYLSLRDENNTVIEELHGLATDETTGAWKYVGNQSTDKLKVWDFKKEFNSLPDEQYPGIVLYQNNKASVLTTWQKSTPCKDTINKMNISYPPYGFTLHTDTENSNSVAYTLMLCMGLDAEHLGLITPGWGKNLLNSN